ncbi:hypothetical protein SAMN04487819_12152 [Actinopolyspora alba]|uniref:Solute:sodium symporter small subunit n=1 Tax=Actinopolyspora alba TaxID=673379 RepID=A0A1I2CFE1_9ACTN|nr:hypothetical protein [Actinopolyspora alba]SFE66825.1 hypothetical protein SAMN04487819_12152 [Actinopolyspora alba]
MSEGKRVPVMSPQTRMARVRRVSRTNWSEPPLGPAELERATRLYRAQRFRGAITLSGLVLLVFGLPLVQAYLPMVTSSRLAGIPAAWLIPVIVPFPAMVLLAWRQLRRAELLERHR